MKIVLVNPPDIQQLTEMDEPSHGLAYIAAVLHKKGYAVKVLDGKVLKISVDDILTEINKYEPDLVGITAMTPDVLSAAEIARRLKCYRKKLPIILGGVHGTALPKKTLDEFPSFDTIVRGEGEETILEILELYNHRFNNYKESLLDIKGIAFRLEDEVIITAERPFIENLDSIPFPVWNFFSCQRAIYSVYASRGCPFRCKFCMRALGNRVRKRSPENIILEIERNINEYGCHGWWFSDETFGLDKKWLFELLDLLIEKKLNRMNWSANSRVNLADLDTYKKMKEAGCRHLDFGIESGNDEILGSVSKNITKQQVLEAIKICREVKIAPRAFFIIGHPYETKKTVWDTIKFAAQLNTETVAFGRMIPYPGTEIFQMAKNGEGDYINLNTNWFEYRKYHGNPVQLKELRNSDLIYYQFIAYAFFYIKNLRIKEFFLMLWQHRQSAIYYFKKLLRPRKSK